jgi:hypothetical protein
MQAFLEIDSWIIEFYQGVSEFTVRSRVDYPPVHDTQDYESQTCCYKYEQKLSPNLVEIDSEPGL